MVIKILVSLGVKILNSLFSPLRTPIRVFCILFGKSVEMMHFF